MSGPIASMADLANALLHQHAEATSDVSPQLYSDRRRAAPLFHPDARVRIDADDAAGFVTAVRWDEELGWTYTVETDAGWIAAYREAELTSAGAGR